MLSGQLAVVPSSTTVFSGGGGRLLLWTPFGRRQRRRRTDIFWVSAVVNKNQQNYYTVLGVSSSASSSDIKKAYRLLARKWHPDVSKDSRAGEIFKSIHLAYQVLSDEAARVQYDRVLKSNMHASDRIKEEAYDDFSYEDELRMHRWNELRQKVRNDRYKSYNRRYNGGGQSYSSDTESDEEPEEKAAVERDSFFEVLQSVTLSIILMQIFGCQSSILFSSLMAWFDGKLDAGYKTGYLIAVVLGGRAGVLLSLCFSISSWVWGKNSSSLLTLAVTAIWIGSNILRYAPLPQGALIALLYMSVKLQADLS